MEEKKKKEELFKVFFITSNQTSLDDNLEYSLEESGMVNLHKVLSKTFRYENQDFTTSVFSFDIIKDDLRNNDFDKKRKSYKAIIKLNQKKIIYVLDTKFEGYILFKATKNNFIFDFKFENYKGYTGTYLAPPSIECPYSFQIKLYREA